MRLSHTQLAEAALELSRETEAQSSDIARGLLAFVRRRRLTRHLGGVLAALEQASAREEGHLSVTVTSARALAESEQGAVLTALQHIFPAVRPDPIFRIDPALLGGLRIETADTRYDGSVARTLSTLAQSLSHCL